MPEFRASIGAVRESIVFDQDLVRLKEIETIPDTVCFGVADDALPDAFESQPAAGRQFAPAVFGVVVVVGEVAGLDEQRLAVAREQSGGKTSRLQVANRDVHA